MVFSQISKKTNAYAEYNKNMLGKARLFFRNDSVYYIPQFKSLKIEMFDFFPRMFFLFINRTSLTKFLCKIC